MSRGKFNFIKTENYSKSKSTELFKQFFERVNVQDSYNSCFFFINVEGSDPTNLLSRPLSLEYPLPNLIPQESPL